VNHTRLVVTAPSAHPSTPGPVTATVTVDTATLESASGEAWLGMTTLLGSVIRKKGGSTDRTTWTWSAEPIGPQLRLVTVNGARL
jgi:hypothetical protein